MSPELPEAPLTFDGQVLNGTALTAAAVWGEGVPLDAAASPDTAAQNVVWVQVISALHRANFKN